MNPNPPSLAQAAAGIAADMRLHAEHLAAQSAWRERMHARILLALAQIFLILERMIADWAAGLLPATPARPRAQAPNAAPCAHAPSPKSSGYTDHFAYPHAPESVSPRPDATQFNIAPGNTAPGTLHSKAPTWPRPTRATATRELTARQSPSQPPRLPANPTPPRAPMPHAITHAERTHPPPPRFFKSPLHPPPQRTP